jgi:hypothetical protein
MNAELASQNAMLKDLDTGAPRVPRHCDCRSLLPNPVACLPLRPPTCIGAISAIAVCLASCSCR